MATERHIPIQRSIATRLLRQVFVCYLLIAAGVTVGHMVMEYRYQKESIRNDLKNIQKTFEKPLGLSMWKLDNKVLDSTIEGMLEIPTIEGVKIYNARSECIAVGGIVSLNAIAGTTEKQVNILGFAEEDMQIASDQVYDLELFEHTFPVLYQNGQTRRELGSVTIYSSTSVILRRVKLGFALLLVNAVFKTAALWLIFLWVAQRLLRKPLAALADATDQISLETLGEARIQVDTQGRNELKVVEESFNRMIDKLHLSVEERLQAEEARARDAENLRITLNSIGDAVIATDGQGIIRRMNPVAESLTGWPDEEAVGRPLGEVFSIRNALTNEPCRNPVDQVLESGEVIALANHTVLSSRDGNEYQIADSGAPIRNAKGEIVGVVLVFRDVTEQYRLENQLRQSEKLQAVGQLAGGIAHDFNNMLGGIIGAADLLNRRVNLEPKDKEYLGLITHAAQSAADLTQKLLDFSRKGKSTSTPVNVHDTIHEAVAILERSIDRRVSVEMDLKAESSCIVGDPAQLQNAILNLGINARDAMPEGGTLTISSENILLRQADCDACASEIEPGEYLQISVRDTGAGIEPKVLDRIFEPFFTTKEEGEGTGLGLAAVYGTVQEHRGDIQVWSEPDRGTVFRICLPVEEGEASSQSRGSVGVSDFTCDATVLLVDDESVMRITAGQLLEEMGCTVLIASDGDEGLELYREKGEEIDLVILDMVMPKRNGSETFRAIRQLNCEARVILASGFARQANMSDLFDEGLAGFLKKPFHFRELAQVLRDNVPH